VTPRRDSAGGFLTLAFSEDQMEQPGLTVGQGQGDLDRILVDLRLVVRSRFLICVKYVIPSQQSHD
jgi:hypothetical protein